VALLDGVEKALALENAFTAKVLPSRALLTS
jgi:hypothetical protein